MNNIISDTIKYIDEHLSEELEIEHLASRANYSIYYFKRMFSTLTGYGLKEYIRERKLTKAAFDIIESDHKIIDIAYQYGFKTPESFRKHLSFSIMYLRYNYVIVKVPLMQHHLLHLIKERRLNL